MFYIRPIARDDVGERPRAVRAHRHRTHDAAGQSRAAGVAHRTLARVVRRDRRARRRVLHVRAGRRPQRHAGPWPASGPHRRHQRHRSGGRPDRAFLQLPRRHAGPRVARARCLHGRADAVPRQRPHRPHRALLAVPRPGFPAGQERRAAGEEPAAVHRGIRTPLLTEDHRRAARTPDGGWQEPVLGRPGPALLRDGIFDGRLPDRHRAEVVHRRIDAEAPGLREPAARRRARRDRRRAHRHGAGAHDARTGRLSLRRATSTSSTPVLPSNVSATTYTLFDSRKSFR